MPLDLARVQAAGTASPATTAEVATRLQEASAAGKSVLPCGGGCFLDLGGPRPAADLLLRTDRLRQTVFYEPQELVVKVEAGMTLADLQALLREKGQEMPWDYPWADRQTVGGIVAAGIAGPRRLGFGMPRDHVLGVTLVLPGGQVIRPGGRVVKNVAGYDLTRLAVGAHGTLGVLTEVALKVKPLAEQAWAATVTLATADAVGAMVGAIVAAPAAPVLLDVQGRWGRYLLTVGCEGSAAQVAAERELLLKAVGGGAPALELRDGAIGVALAAAGAALWGSAGAIFRVSVPRSRLSDVLQAVEGPVYAQAGNGVVRIAPGRTMPAGEARDFLARLHRLAAELGGWAVQERGPLPAGEAEPGLSPRARALTEGIKRVFDPAGSLENAWR